MTAKDVKVGMWFLVKQAPTHWSSGACSKNPLEEKFPMLVCIEKIVDRGEHIAVMANGFGWDLARMLEVAEPATDIDVDKYKFFL